MIVTNIEELDKKRVRVYIDYEFAFVLYKGELRLYKLYVNKEIENNVYEEIVNTVLTKRAKLRCMNLLKSKEYTEKQLRDKLHKGEYRAEIVEEAIKYVKSYGYINDRKYAEDYALYQSEKKSLKRIEQDLLRKGINRTIISDVLCAVKESKDAPDEMVMAKELLRKKNYNAQTASMKDKQRLSAFLYRKGFTPETIRNVLLLDITSNSV